MSAGAVRESWGETQLYLDMIFNHILPGKGGGANMSHSQIFLIAPKWLNFLWWSHPDVKFFWFTLNLRILAKDQTAASDVSSMFLKGTYGFFVVFELRFRVKSDLDVLQTIWMLYRRYNVHTTSMTSTEDVIHNASNKFWHLNFATFTHKIGPNLSQITI